MSDVLLCQRCRDVFLQLKQTLKVRCALSKKLMNNNNNNLRVMYKRVVINKPEFAFLKVQLCFTEERAGKAVDRIVFKSNLTKAIRTLFGEVGASLNVDVLKYSEKTREAILRVPASALVRVQSALTLFSRFEEQDCVFNTLQISPHLISLAVNSRDIDQ